jgi:hypothetical protein
MRSTLAPTTAADRQARRIATPNAMARLLENV